MYRLDIPTKNEHNRLLEVWEASVRATHHFLKEEDIGFFKNMIVEHEIFDDADITVARDAQNNIVGFVGVSGDSLEMLFLHPGSIGEGVGKQLITYAIETQKVQRVEVNEQNVQAVQFYNHFGFKTISRSEDDGFGKPYPLLFMQRLS
ncbi:MAG: GNAT family N-acetyltransferase [Bacteroidetes bacterium]|nr:GNAT family N-acetyltransferase [Bacteroidota bacterium]